MKMTAISVAKLSSVKRVMYLTRALRLKMTISRIKPEVQRPIQTRAGRNSQSLSLEVQFRGIKNYELISKIDGPFSCFVPFNILLLCLVNTDWLFYHLVREEGAV